jgi:lauroyl/myristoyl acyltransferase
VPHLDLNDPSRPIKVPIGSWLKSAARILTHRALPLKWTIGMSQCSSAIKVRLDRGLRARESPVLKPLAPPGTSDREIERQIALSRTIVKIGAKTHAPVFRRTTEWLLRTFRPQGLEHLEAVKRAGGGAIILSTHAGMNAWAAPILQQLGYAVRPTHRARVASDSLLMMRWDGMAHWMVPYPDDRESGAYLKRLYDLIKRGEWIQHVGDFPGQGRELRGVHLGVEVPVPRAPWALGRLTGAPLIPVVVLMERDFTFRLHVGAPIRVADSGVPPEEAMTAALQRYLDFVGERLSANPWNLHLPVRRMLIQGD